MAAARPRKEEEKDRRTRTSSLEGLLTKSEAIYLSARGQETLQGSDSAHQETFLLVADVDGARPMGQSATLPPSHTPTPRSI